MEHNYSCDASAARSEFSSLLNTVQASGGSAGCCSYASQICWFLVCSLFASQGSLAELKLEVAAARQLSAQVSANLPQNHDSFLDLHQHGQAWTPQRPVKAISSVHTSRQEPRQTTLQVQSKQASQHVMVRLVSASLEQMAMYCAQPTSETLQCNAIATDH